jgi:hypothetical protein
VFDGLLHVDSFVLFDAVMRADRMLQLVVHNLSGALGAGAANKHHHSKGSNNVDLGIISNRVSLNLAPKKQLLL